MPSGDVFCEKHRLSTTPVSSVPRQIIGFNPVGKDPDAVGSPRSVLCRIGSGRSPTSPRSGLESLLSSRPSCEKSGRDAVGSSGVPSLSTKKVDVAGNFKVNKPSPKQSNPISIIGQPKSQCSSSFRGENHLFNESFQEAVAWRLRSSQCGTDLRKEDLNGALIDLETVRRKSIFSTASPASSCSDRNDSILEIDFLNACHFCKLQLGSGKDIYVYRGDRAFCSVECRYQYIVLDERKDRCTSSVQSNNAKYRRKVLSSTQAAAA